MNTLKIVQVKAILVLNSNGKPTIEVTVALNDGNYASAAVPSGTSKGLNEAHELIDEDQNFFSGYGVNKAIENVNTKINDALFNISPLNQKVVDQILLSLDGTLNKTNLGSNAILGTSIAVAKVAAQASQKTLFQYLKNSLSYSLPTPMINIINGGAHSNNALSIQEFMLVPQYKEHENFLSLIEKSCNVFYRLKKFLHNKNYSTNVGLEGGFAPQELKNSLEVMDLLSEIVEKSGYVLGEDFKFSLDVAANEFFDVKQKLYNLDNKILDIGELIDFYTELIKKYPIFSIEDPMSELDIVGWQEVSNLLGSKVKLVGDDLFATNLRLLKKFHAQGIANTILIKPNQIGSVTETLEVINYAQEIDYQTICSHRSGDTNDEFIIHLAVATNSKYVKIGSLCRGERIAKFNELLRLFQTGDF